MIALRIRCAGALGAVVLLMLRAEPAARLEQAAPPPIPFRLVGSHLVVVQGSAGTLDRLDLVIDTGSFRSVIDRRVTDRLKLARTREDLVIFGRRTAADGAVIPSLAFAHLQVLDLRALVADMAALEAALGFRPDVLVGMDVLRSHAFTIDYVRATLEFGRGEGGSIVPLEPGSPYPLVVASVDGAQLRLIVDSGAEATVLFEHAVPPALSTRVGAEVDAVHLTGTLRLKRFTASRFALGANVLGPMPVFILDHESRTPDYDGLLATHWLPGDRVHFDFPRRTLSWW